MMNKGLYSSNEDKWSTPQYLFDMLDQEFGFDLDPCATPENAKCEKYYTPLEDGLLQDWKGHIVFCNPPYGRQIGKWVKKAHDEAQDHDTTVVMLLPARTDTAWFHDYILGQAEIRFVRGRLRFGDSKINAQFPSMIVIYR